MKRIKRIVIIGNSGAGKSTLAVALSKRLSLPIYHLDKILWKKNWERTPEDEFIQKHREVIERDEWLLDGVAYKSTYEQRFERADAIIYMDLSPELCFEHAKQRMQEDLERPNPFVSEDCPYGLEYVDQQKELIYSFHKEYRPLILNILKQFEESKLIIYLKDNFNIDDLEAQLREE